MGRWVPVLPIDEVRPGSGRTVRVGETHLAVFNDAGEVLAIDDTCPHQGASLGEGTLHEGRVICPWHSWIFELRTGRCPGVAGIEVRTYPTRFADGAIEVELPEEP